MSKLKGWKKDSDVKDFIGYPMHKATRAELETLPCPKRGEPNRATDFINWD